MNKYWLGPVIGAVIGYFTNYIAVKMLFHPRHEVKVFGHVLPFTPGAIPKEKNRIAKTIGQIVADELLTEQDLIDRCLNPELEQKIIQKLMQRLDQTLESYGIQILKDEQKYHQLVQMTQAKAVDKIMAVINELDLEKILMEQCMEVIDQKIGDNPMLRLMSGSVVAGLSAPLTQQISTFLNGRGKEIIAEKLRLQWEEWEQDSPLELAEQMGFSQDRLEHKLQETYESMVAQVIPLLLDKLNIQGIVEEKIASMSNEELEKLVLTAMKKELSLIVNLGAVIGFVLGCVQLLI